MLRSCVAAELKIAVAAASQHTRLIKQWVNCIVTQTRAQHSQLAKYAGGVSSNGMHDVCCLRVL